MDPAEGAPDALEGAACARRLIETRDELLGFIVAHVRDWNVAEDIFQDLSVVILQKVQQGVVVSNFRAWSREIARRLIREHWRSRKKRPAHLSARALARLDEAFARRQAAVQVSDQELLGRLRQCMDVLPERLQLLLRLFYEEHLSHREIAERVGSTEGAVQVAISRARHRLLQLTQRPH